MTRVIKTLTLLAAVGLVATNVTAQQRGPQAQDEQQRGSQTQKLMSKDELIKKYDTNNDGTFDYREKMAFISSLDENQKTAYRRSFSQEFRNQSQAQQRGPQAQQRGPQAQQRGPQAQQRGPQAQQRGPQAQQRGPHNSICRGCCTNSSTNLWFNGLPVGVSIIKLLGIAPVF